MKRSTTCSAAPLAPEAGSVRSSYKPWRSARHLLKRCRDEALGPHVCGRFRSVSVIENLVRTLMHHAVNRTENRSCPSIMRTRTARILTGGNTLKDLFGPRAAGGAPSASSRPCSASRPGPQSPFRPRPTQPARSTARSATPSTWLFSRATRIRPPRPQPHLPEPRPASSAHRHVLQPDQQVQPVPTHVRRLESRQLPGRRPRKYRNPTGRPRLASAPSTTPTTWPPASKPRTGHGVARDDDPPSSAAPDRTSFAGSPR
jgi:hypothetical protein